MTGDTSDKPRLHPARSSAQAEAEGGGHALAGPCETQLRAGTAGVLGRRYMTRVIARLGELDRQATADRDTEPEAGA
jgi:hypothetical protein